MQTALPGDHLLTGANVEMVGISKNDLGTKFVQFGGGDGLDGALRADGHENRRFNDAAARLQAASPGTGGRIGGKKRVCGRQFSSVQIVFPPTIVRTARPLSFAP